MPLGTEVNFGPGDVVLDGVAAPPKRDTASQFLIHVYCGQTAGWMKMSLGTEVDLGPRHIVLDRVPALHERGTAAPHLFGQCLLWLRSPISATAELLCKRLPQNRCILSSKFFGKLLSICRSSYDRMLEAARWQHCYSVFDQNVEVHFTSLTMFVCIQVKVALK